jgi:hypothetical protein
MVDGMLSVTNEPVQLVENANAPFGPCRDEEVVVS